MKISIIGAGRVGSSTAFALVQHSVADEIVLIDINEDLAEGEALDILHATTYHKRTNVHAGSFEDMRNSDIVIITAGTDQKKGETRFDLLNKNVEIIKSISKKIIHFAPDSIAINITNPVDILSYIIYEVTGFPWQRVIGTGTVLDTARLRSLIASNCNISPSSVHVYVIGEHGDSELAVWSSAMIGGLPIKKFCAHCPKKEKCGNIMEKLFTKTKNAAYEIIKRKGATNYGIAAATTQLVEAIVKNENKVLTPSTFYNGIYIGYPAVIGKRGVKRLVNIELDSNEKMIFEHSKEIIREHLNKVNIKTIE